MSTDQVEVIFEDTPNPASMKFIISREISSDAMQFNTSQDAARSPLASKIFGFPWTETVYLGTNFITVTKAEWVDWETLATPLAGLIKEHIERGEPIFREEFEPATEEDDENDSPVVKQIKQMLNTEIRPAVAMDGGDVVFLKFENGIVYVSMQGACAGCPSSTMTLKMGIEARLKDSIPEVQEVRQI